MVCYPKKPWCARNQVLVVYQNVKSLGNVRKVSLESGAEKAGNQQRRKGNVNFIKGMEKFYKQIQKLKICFGIFLESFDQIYH